MSKLTKAQRRALECYDGLGVTRDTFGSIATFNALVRLGYLRRSHGLGVIEAEITPAGRLALDGQEAGS